MADKNTVALYITLILIILIVILSLFMFFGHWGFFPKYKPKVPDNAFLVSSIKPFNNNT
jgi:hypothetical protein